MTNLAMPLSTPPPVVVSAVSGVDKPIVRAPLPIPIRLAAILLKALILVVLAIRLRSLSSFSAALPLFGAVRPNRAIPCVFP